MSRTLLSKSRGLVEHIRTNLDTTQSIFKNFTTCLFFWKNHQAKFMHGWAVIVKGWLQSTVLWTLNLTEVLTFQWTNRMGHSLQDTFKFLAPAVVTWYSHQNFLHMKHDGVFVPPPMDWTYPLDRTGSINVWFMVAGGGPGCWRRFTAT